jgi:WD40 repeat protein
MGHARPAQAVTWSADGRWLATGDAGTTVRLWDARRRTPKAVWFRNVVDLSLSPDGKLLAATFEVEHFAGGLEIRSVPDLELVRTLALPIGALGRFSRDGRSLVYGARDGRVWTVDTRTWKPRERPLRVGPGIRSAALSPDGRLLAATSLGGAGGLWDVRSRRPVGAALSGGTGDPVATAFLGGSLLAVLHERGGVAWDVRPGAWKRHACVVAGRALTRGEWQALLPRHRYAPACARP